MQLLTNKSEEGSKTGLGFIDAETIKFKFSPDQNLKIPHMGWNYIKVQQRNKLIELDTRHRFYFVHSYYVKCNNPANSIATANYGQDFSCMINSDNIYGAQFHPEKSLKFGMEILTNFSKI
jgi:glutamine amidotransferase